MTSDQEQPSTTAEPPTGEDENAEDPAAVDEAPTPTDDPPARAEEAAAVMTDEPAAPASADEPAAPAKEAGDVMADDEPTTPEADDTIAAAAEQTTNPSFDEPPAPDGTEISATPEGEPATESPDDAPGSRRSVLVGLSLLAVVLVGILVAVLATGGGDSGSSGAPSATTAPAGSTAPTLPQAAFKSFHDDLTGFTIQYPGNWQQAQAPVSELRLFVTPGEGEAVSVRVNETEQATTPENLANIKSVTDGTIASNPTAKVLKNSAITLNGLIGYYYLYTFKDEASGLEGVHAHYFLFKGHRMYSIVFQVLPTDQFAQFAGVFDQMAQSFKVDG